MTTLQKIKSELDTIMSVWKVFKHSPSMFLRRKTIKRFGVLLSMFGFMVFGLYAVSPLWSNWLLLPFALTTNKSKKGTPVVMTVTSLQSLASSATVGWQSVRVDDSGTGIVNAIDYEICVKVTTANTAPANDKAVYIYVSPAYYDGSTWYQTDGGTTTLPGGTEAAYTTANPNDLLLLGTLSYTTQQMVMQGSWMLSNVVGQFMPDGFQIVIVNFTGAAFSTGCVVDYTPVSETNS